MPLPPAVARRRVAAPNLRLEPRAQNSNHDQRSDAIQLFARGVTCVTSNAGTYSCDPTMACPASTYNQTASICICTQDSTTSWECTASQTCGATAGTCADSAARAATVGNTGLTPEVLSAVVIVCVVVPVVCLVVGVYLLRRYLKKRRAVIMFENEGVVAPDLDDTRYVFISYCWTNSISATPTTTTATDPRAIARRLVERHHIPVWIDHIQMQGKHPLVAELATAVAGCAVVVAFVSDEYAASDNCFRELSYAMGTLRKPTVVVAVGDEGLSWRRSRVGFVVADELFIDWTRGGWEDRFDDLLQRIKPYIEGEGTAAAAATVPQQQSP